MFASAGLGALAVFFLRASSVLRCWHWEITDGREGPGIYAIWRLLHGYPLYEWPHRPPYSLTLYNFGFYYFYAGVMRLLGANDEALLLAPRGLTLLASGLGAVLFARLAWLYARPRGTAAKVALVAFSFCVWFGTQFMSWWPLDIRPDVWALLIGLAGVALVLRGLATESRWTFVAASVVFWCAWALKQSAILSLLGSLAAVFVLKRNFRQLLALALPFAVLTALSLLLGGERYRFSILVAPAISRYRVSLALEVLSRAVPQNAWVFAFAPCVFLFDARRGFAAAWRRRALAEQALLVIGAVAVALGSAGLGREGGNKNYLFDGYVTSALAGWITLVRLLDTQPSPRAALWFGGALLAPWSLFPFAQLARPGKLGRIELCTTAAVPELARAAAAIARLPRPLYADHDVFSQPWRATGNRYPAVVLDGTWSGIAVREGLTPPDFLDAWLAERHFASALVPAGVPQIETFRAHGARCSDFPELVDGLRFVACRLPYADSARETSP
jgi:hypothetical protein